MKLSNIFKRDPKKARALTLAKQAGAAYDYAARKGGNAVSGRTKTKYKKRNKIKGKHNCPTPPRTEQRKKKAPYEPGKLGPSAVSVSIKENFGIIIDRDSRKGTAKLFGNPVKKFYNGEGPKRDRSYGRRANRYAH